MAYEFISYLRHHDDGTVTKHLAMVCSDCRMPITLNPSTGEFAAYDAPRVVVVDMGHGETKLVPRDDFEVALCSECYAKAFQIRYPGAEPPPLHDGRMEGSTPVPINSTGISVVAHHVLDDPEIAGHNPANLRVGVTSSG